MSTPILTEPVRTSAGTHTHLLMLGGPRARARGVALFAKGFRPFFLLSALYALAGVPLWIATLAGVVPFGVTSNPLDWHAHEMVFGYTGGVLAGFLLTAVSRWTGRPTLEGSSLAALAATWLGARVLPFVPSVPPSVAAFVDVSFWLGLLLGCARPILAARDRRNYAFIALMAAFALAAAYSHANRLGYVQAEFWSVRSLGVDLVSIAIVVMTGRVVPSFTRNATHATDIEETRAQDRAAAAALALVTALDAAAVAPRWSAAPAALAGVLTLVRARRWGAKHTRTEPLLWSLHLANAWVGAGLVLRGLVPLVPALPANVALHALTVGGIGLLTLSMMVRVTLGHTGRMLSAPPSIGLALAALALCALIRVVGPLVVPEHLVFALAVAALLWALAFGAYLAVFGRALVTRRVDGRPG